MNHEKEEKLKKKEMEENNKSDKHVLEDGKVDVSKKYGVSGKVLSQGRIDSIVEEYKKKRNR